MGNECLIMNSGFGNKWKGDWGPHRDTSSSRDSTGVLPHTK